MASVSSRNSADSRSASNRQETFFWPTGVWLSLFLRCDMDDGPLCSLVEPDPQQGTELVHIHRFGDVIRSAGLEASFAVAFHGLGGDREDRQFFEIVHLAAAANGLAPVHYRHHPIHEGHFDVRMLLPQIEGGLTALGIVHLHLVTLQG